MTSDRIENMIGGWFVGNITPAVFTTQDVEVAVKHYKKGDFDKKHYHKIATEITLIILGKVKMNGQIFNTGDIIKIEPNEATDFLALEDTITTVVKVPGANNDKYIVEND